MFERVPLKKRGIMDKEILKENIDLVQHLKNLPMLQFFLTKKG